MDELLTSFSKAKKAYSSTEKEFDSFVSETQKSIKLASLNSFLLQTFFSSLAELQIFKDEEVVDKFSQKPIFLDRFCVEESPNPKVKEDYEQVVANLKIFFKKFPKIFVIENIQEVQLPEPLIEDLFSNLLMLVTSNENLFVFYLERLTLFLLFQDMIKQRKRFFSYGEKFIWNEQYIFKEFMSTIMKRAIKVIRDLFLVKVSLDKGSRREAHSGGSLQLV